MASIPPDDDGYTQGSSKKRSAPPASSPRRIEVVAPSDLPEGYKFEAQLGDRVIAVTVPKGGVSEGQKFSVPLPSVEGIGNESALSLYTIPREKWRDGMWDCCKHGCCHPMLWNAMCCPAIAIAQIMTRMKLTWLGNPANPIQARQTFKRVASMLIIFILFEIILRYFMVSQAMKYAFESDFREDDQFDYEKPSRPPDYGPLYKTARAFTIVLEIAFAIYVLVVMTKTRLSIRETYEIEEEYFDRCEDFCCVFWCTCCTMTQMARHTADYERYESVCCSDTGLPSHVPPIV